MLPSRSLGLLLVLSAVQPAGVHIPAPPPVNPPSSSTGVPEMCFDYTQSIPWPTTTPGPFDVTRTLVGDFDGDLRQDVMALDAGQPLYLYAPANWAIVHPVAIVANDIDTARGAGTNGHDAVAMVGSAGLELLDFDAASGTFLPIVISASPAWQDARLVRSADFDDNGRANYVGVSSNGSSMVSLRWNGVTHVETTYDIGDQVQDVTFLRWNDDSSLELAILTAHGLQIRDYSGNLLRAHTTTSSAADQIVTVTLAGRWQQYVGWLRQNLAGTGQEFVLASRRGIQPQFNVPAALGGIYALVGADASYTIPAQDGDTDVLFCASQGPSPWVAQNLSNEPSTPANGPYFDASANGPLCLESTVPLVMPTTPGAMHPRPVWADLTGDERVDYFAFEESTSEWRFFEGVTTGIKYLHGEGLLQEVVFQTDATTGFDELLIKLNYGPMALHGTPGIWSDFEVRVWRQDDYDAPIAAVASYSLPIPQETDPLVQWENAGSGFLTPFVVARTSLEHLENHPGGDACFPAIYWFELRWVIYDASQTLLPIVHVSPMYAAFVAASPADEVNLWVPCYSLLLDLQGLNTCPTYPPAYFYSTPTCQLGSTQLAPGKTFGTRRRVLPAGESGSNVPQPAPVDPNPLYSGWWGSPI